MATHALGRTADCVTRIAVVLFAAASVAGCLGDPPPDPATAPLEVVLDGCQLNRDEVAPGTHEVALVGEGRLVVEDESGSEVLRLEGGAGSLVTTAQTYALTCTVDGSASTATLRSVAKE